MVNSLVDLIRFKSAWNCYLFSPVKNLVVLIKIRSHQNRGIEELGFNR